MNSSISLSSYKEQFTQDLSRFELPVDQLGYTGLPSEVLDLSISDPNRYPIVIVKDEHVPVGFFVLHMNSDIAKLVNNPKAILLRALSVSYPYQGKGYAKEAMSLVPRFVLEHFPDVDEIVLAVNSKNIAAQQLYIKTGFEDKGFRKIGIKGPQYIYHFKVK
ncbi:GNAT family N-acetyltransferase [Paenibacillus puldeungensis]|uniref:GNAT family N-acetyltransferase n=1 Tax=Paenibacillus puldeungensis TaxID=696536 RepID=A0ABW3S0P5_9BACL